MFNLEISQNGWHVPFQKCPGSNYEIEILNNWHHRTDSSRFAAIVFQPNLMLLRFNCHFLWRKKWTWLSLSFHNENKRTNSTNQAWIKSNVGRKSKCTLQSLLELRGMPDPKTTRTHVAWNDSHFAPSCRICKLTYFSKFTFIIACYFRSTYIIWGNFFFCVSMTPR